MKREDEILKAAQDYVSGVTLSSPSNVIHFEYGAKWADEHPNLKSLWHNASVMPKEKEWILVQFRDDRYDTFVQRITCQDIWYAWCKSNHIEHWAYISDLLPKGGTK